MYILGQKYGGEELRKVKRYGQRGYRNDAHKGIRNLPRRDEQGNGRRFSSSWIRGVKGCFVCGKDHLERLKTPIEEVTADIENLK